MLERNTYKINTSTIIGFISYALFATMLAMMLATLQSVNSQAFSGGHNNTLARAIDSSNCENVRAMPGGSSVAGIEEHLKAIPDSTTIAQAGLTHDDLVGSVRNSRIIDVYPDREYMHIFTEGGASCRTMEQLLRYGSSLIDDTNPGEVRNNQAVITAAIASMRQGWISEICNDSIDPQCREVADREINQLVVACASAIGNKDVPSIRSFEDLNRCAGGSATLTQIKERNCVDSGGTWEDDTCIPAAESTCDVDGGLGWLICPLMKTVANINDAAWIAIEGFLMTPAINTDTSSSTNGVYVAWSIVRNVANAAFVVAFLVVIFSQVTSAGISNYGIKKMLPKLIVGAVLVNTSYWITALAVDVSNLIGSSVYSLFRGIAESIPVSDSLSLGENLSWAALTATLLVIGTVSALWAGLAVLIPLALGAMLSFLGILITLTLRHAIVIVLIVVAPLAFVAYLLPNTEKLFKSWFSLLKILLLIYPIIAFVFAVSHIAQSAVLSAALHDEQVMLQMFALAMPAMAIALIPMLIKLTGGVLGRFGVDNPLGGVTRTVKDAGKQFGERKDKEFAARGTAGTGFLRRRVLGNVGGHRQRMLNNMRSQTADARLEAATLDSDKGRELNRDLGAAQQQLAISKTKAEIDELSTNQTLHVDAEIQKLGLEASRQQLGDDVAKTIQTSTESATIAGGTMAHGSRRATASATARLDKRMDETVENFRSEMSSQDMNQLYSTLKDNQRSVEERSAAARQIFKRGADQHIHEALDYMAKNNTTPEMKSIQALSAESAMARPSAAWGAGAYSELTKGNLSTGYNESLESRLDAGKIGANELMSMSQDDRLRLAQLMADKPAVRAKHAASLMASMNTVRSTPEMKAKMTDEIERTFNDILSGNGPTLIPDGMGGTKNPLDNHDFKKR